MTAGNGNEGEVNWGAGERETAIEDQAGGQSRTVQQSIRVPALEEHGVTTSNSRLHLFRKFARRSEYRGEYALGGEIRHLPEPPFRPRESPMGNAKLHRILRFRMGSHHLPVEEGRHFNLPRASRVCNLCNTDALGDERHMLLECPALADLRLQFSSLLLPCSGVMRRLLWAKDQHEVCRYIIACLDRMSSH